MLSVRHLRDTTSLTADDITQILDTARSFAEINARKGIKKVPALRGRTIVNLFLEPSTRTRSSFELGSRKPPPLLASFLNSAAMEASRSHRHLEVSRLFLFFSRQHKTVLSGWITAMKPETRLCDV